MSETFVRTAGPVSADPAKYREVSAFLAAIDMPEEMAEAVLAFLQNEPEQNKASCYEGVPALAAHLLLSAKNRVDGPWKGLPETIFIATMGCFSRFVREHFRSYGTWGFDRDFWTTRQANARLFRIGELEYELAEGEQGEKEIWLHIPSDARLFPSLLNASVRDARAFLRDYFPQYAGLPVQLESWLIWPGLGNMLQPSSRILHFQQAFDVQKTEADATDYLEWVFQVAGGQRESVVLADLPENTSLQRAMKAHLLTGGKIGIGYGVLAREFL